MQSQKPKSFSEVKIKPEINSKAEVHKNFHPEIDYHGPEFVRPDYLKSDLFKFNTSNNYKVEIELLSSKRETSGDSFIIY